MSRSRQEESYQAVYEIYKETGDHIDELCKGAKIARSSYYKWRKRERPESEIENIKISKLIKKIHEEDPSKGYRRIKDDLLKEYGEKVNDKRVLRICRVFGIRSNIKYRRGGCTINDREPKYTAENILNRKFKAEKPDMKWLTDVTEFKYYVEGEKKKLYLSAILDLYDRRIVSYEIGDSNNNELVFKTFEKAVKLNPDAHPLFHSDRGFQYTSPDFHEKLEAAKMTQSMSRVGKCLDNGPMEGFWGILKRERYYGMKYTSKKALVEMITSYIDYYNNKRYQRKLNIMTPMEKHQQYFATVA